MTVLPPQGALNSTMKQASSKMSHNHYKSFCRLVLGLYYDTWALHHTERAFQNLIIQDLDTIMYYWDSDIYNMD